MFGFVCSEPAVTKLEEKMRISFFLQEVDDRWEPTGRVFHNVIQTKLESNVLSILFPGSRVMITEGKAVNMNI